MKTGVLTYLALPVMFIIGPALIGTMLWAPGLLDVLNFLGLSGLTWFMSWVFAISIAMLLVGSTISAVGTFHVAEHVRDMAPWMIAFPLVVGVANAVR